MAAESIDRARLLRRGASGLLALGIAPAGTALAGVRRTHAALRLTARNVGRRYAGDRTLFATVSPGVPGRDTA
ncbi:MAG: hypothetical protein EXQ81_04715, partial [Thermoleophilia bacterium]|nr:hypothetical protein [Thermoleophilia bacterium]